MVQVTVAIALSMALAGDFSSDAAATKQASVANAEAVTATLRTARGLEAVDTETKQMSENISKKTAVNISISIVDVAVSAQTEVPTCSVLGTQNPTVQVNGIECVRAGDGGTRLDASFLSKFTLPEHKLDPHILSISLRSMCAQVSTIRREFSCNHDGIVIIRGVEAHLLHAINSSPSAAGGFQFKVNPIVVTQNQPQKYSAGKIEEVAREAFDPYDRAMIVFESKCSCQNMAMWIGLLSDITLRTNEEWTYPLLGPSTFPAAAIALESGASYTIAPPSLSTTGRPIEFFINDTAVTDGITYSLSFASSSSSGGEVFAGDPGGMYVDSRSGEVMGRPKRTGTFFGTLEAQQTESSASCKINDPLGSSCDYKQALQGRVGVRVWTWKFVVLPATVLVITNGSVTRSRTNNLLPVGQSGESIGKGDTYQMQLGGKPFYLGPIKTINCSCGAFGEKCTRSSEDSWEYMLHGTPPGFLIDVSTGEVQGNPISTMNRTEILIRVRDSQAREASVESFFLEIRLADKDLDSNGPGNASCDPRGTAEVNDAIPFDGAFACSCSKGWAGTNCQNPPSNINLQDDDDTVAMTLLGSCVAVSMISILILTIGPRAWRHYIRLRPHDFSMLKDGEKPKEILRRNILLLRCVGAGAFGEVWKASLRRHENESGSEHDITVAVKRVKLRENRSSGVIANDYTERITEENNKLLDEAELMAKVGYHEHLVTRIGATTSGNQPYCLVMSYCEHGSLRKVLKIDSSQGAAMSELGSLEIGLNIIHGMQHLVKRSVVHRDLAARNVMVTSGMSSTGYVARVADFGLSRFHIGKTAEEEYYRSKSGVFPLRWTAPEAIEHLKFTQASDVWSFAIVMIEIFQNGQRPYSDHTANSEVLALTLSGKRHSRPDRCPTGVYKLLMECWDEDVNKRPTFSKLSEAFSQLHGLGDLVKHASAGARGGSLPDRQSAKRSTRVLLPSDDSIRECQNPRNTRNNRRSARNVDSDWWMDMGDASELKISKIKPLSDGDASNETNVLPGSQRSSDYEYCCVEVDQPANIGTDGTHDVTVAGIPTPVSTLHFTPSQHSHSHAVLTLALTDEFGGAKTTTSV
jgi:serine/threonine protein kinase